MFVFCELYETSVNKSVPTEIIHSNEFHDSLKPNRFSMSILKNEAGFQPVSDQPGLLS